jgi:hypothetical protein
MHCVRVGALGFSADAADDGVAKGMTASDGERSFADAPLIVAIGNLW